MKKNYLAAVLVLLAYTATAQPPQGGQHQGPPSVEERLKRNKEMFEKELKATPQQLAVMESSFKTFFAEADKLRKDNPPPAPPPQDPKVKEAMEKISKQRDEAIKKVLTPQQFEQYTALEKKMRPQGPGGKRKEGPPPAKQ